MSPDANDAGALASGALRHGLDRLAGMLRKLASPGWAMLEYGWYPLLLFIATPYFLQVLGTERYGHWMMLTAAVGFGSVLYAGTGAATVKEVSAGIGRGDGNHARRTVGSSLAIALIGGSALAILVLGAFWFAGDLLFEKMGDRSLLRLTGMAAAMLLWIEQLDNVFSSAIKGAEQFGRAARVEMASKTGQVLAAALAITILPALWALYAALVVVALARLYAKLRIARTMLGLGRIWPSLSDAGDILHFAKWGWLQGVGSLLFGVADRLLVGALLGASSLAYYSIASQLALQVHAVAAAGLSVIFPKISRKLERDADFSVWRVARVVMAANLAFSSVLALGLLWFGRDILVLWLGPETAAACTDLLHYLVAAYWILALNVVPYYVLLGAGRVRVVGIVSSLSGLLGVASMYLAVASGGLDAAPIGRAIYALLTTALFLAAMRSLHSKGHRVSRGTLAP